MQLMQQNDLQLMGRSVCQKKNKGDKTKQNTASCLEYNGRFRRNAVIEIL